MRCPRRVVMLWGQWRCDAFRHGCLAPRGQPSTGTPDRSSQNGRGEGGDGRHVVASSSRGLTVNGDRVRLTAMPDFLEKKRREIDARLKELRPLVEEFHRL